MQPMRHMPRFIIVYVGVSDTVLVEVRGQLNGVDFLFPSFYSRARTQIAMLVHQSTFT